MTTSETETRPGLDQAARKRLALLADRLIAGGAGLPSASAVDVQGKWIDRAMAARPDLVRDVHLVLSVPGEPQQALDRLRTEDGGAFDRFAYLVAGAYLMVPRVRKLLGLPGNKPKEVPAYPDESEYYLRDGILDSVIERGPIYRPTPPQ